MNDAIETILKVSGDYHSPLTREKILVWVNQFDTGTKEIILRELAFVLKKGYFSKDRVVETIKKGLKKIIEIFPGTSICDFSFVQGYSSGGTSQQEILDILEDLISTEHGLHVDCCGNGCHFALFDDCAYSGNKLKNTAIGWIEKEGEPRKKLVVLPLVYHKKSLSYLERSIKKAALGKLAICEIKPVMMVKNEVILGGSFQGYAPPLSCDHQEVTAFIENNLNTSFIGTFFRPNGFILEEKFFTSLAAREVVERQFLIHGARLLNLCSSIGRSTRPLGFETLQSLGFGTPLVFYRNIPNNAPIVFWWSVKGWEPLFERITYADRANWSSVDESGKEDE